MYYIRLFNFETMPETNTLLYQMKSRLRRLKLRFLYFSPGGLIQPLNALKAYIVINFFTFNRGGFPGSQPVSMDVSNIRFLHEKLYRVTWKADGVR